MRIEVKKDERRSTQPARPCFANEAGLLCSAPMYYLCNTYEEKDCTEDSLSRNAKEFSEDGAMRKLLRDHPQR